MLLLNELLARFRLLVKAELSGILRNKNFVLGYFKDDRYLCYANTHETGYEVRTDFAKVSMKNSDPLHLENMSIATIKMKITK